MTMHRCLTVSDGQKYSYMRIVKVSMVLRLDLIELVSHCILHEYPTPDKRPPKSGMVDRIAAINDYRITGS
jgi:hypothetical protein